MTSFLSRDFEDLSDQIKSEDNSCMSNLPVPATYHRTYSPAITNLYLLAAGLHLRLSAFFDIPTTKDYRQDLFALYISTTAFCEAALSLETSVGVVLSYSTNYIFQMMLAAGFTLLKLSNSFFATHIEMNYTKSLFNRTHWAIRNASVTSNDLPDRLAEVLAQMWKTGGASQRNVTPGNGEMDSVLQLKVRCRMSMSLVFDSVWRWREDFQAKGRSLESNQTPFPPSSLSHTLTISQPISKTQQTQTLPPKAALVPSPPEAQEIRVSHPLQWWKWAVMVLAVD